MLMLLNILRCARALPALRRDVAHNDAYAHAVLVPKALSDPSPTCLRLMLFCVGVAEGADMWL